LYDELTMRVLSALLLVSTGLAAGWQGFKASRKRGESHEPASGQAWVDPTRFLTRVRDLLLILSLALVFSVIISPGLVLDSVWELSFPLDSAVQTLGVILIASGSILVAWAFRTLGEFAMEGIVLVKNHRLVQTGPYGLVRHPMYGSTILIGLGLFLLYLNIVFLILYLPVFVIDSYRADVEERLLSSPVGFGSGYADYRKRTRRFIPYLL
jgi:protein-S-isoprenylcysteine O-methyltransferase Ste14